MEKKPQHPPLHFSREAARNMAVKNQAGGHVLPPHVSAAEVMPSSNFVQARALYLDLFMAPYDNNPFLVGLMGAAGRSVAFLTALRIAALQKADDPSTFFTPTRMQQVAARSLVISPRTMTSALARLRETGYLASEPVPGDRRQKLLRPTEKALSHYGDWVMGHIRPLAMMFPDRDYSTGLKGGNDFLLAQRRAGAQVIAHSGKVLASNPDIVPFLTRDAGFFILAVLLQSATDAVGMSASPLGELARRFGISRTQVRRVLEVAQAAGLLEIRAPGRTRRRAQPQARRELRSLLRGPDGGHRPDLRDCRRPALNDQVSTL
jgi:DNA-binding MarR family transcriptional regulator